MRHMTRNDARSIARAVAAQVETLTDRTEARALEALLHEIGEDGATLYAAAVFYNAGCCCSTDECACYTWRDAAMPVDFLIERDELPDPLQCEEDGADCTMRADVLTEPTDADRELLCRSCHESRPTPAPVVASIAWSVHASEWPTITAV